MIPPPGCADEPHSQRSRTGVRKRAQPGTGRLKNSCSSDSSPWKMLPSVRPVVALDVERREHLAVEDEVRMFGRELGDRVDDGVAERLALVVPGRRAPGQLVRRVLDEAADDVLAGRRHRRVDQGRDDHVDVRPAAEAAVLGVVVGLLHVVERRAEADGAAEVLARRPGRQVKSGSPSSARLTLPDEPRNLKRRTSASKSGSSVPGSRRSRNVRLRVERAQDRAARDLLAGLQHDAGRPAAAGR